MDGVSKYNYPYHEFGEENLSSLPGIVLWAKSYKPLYSQEPNGSWSQGFTYRILATEIQSFIYYCQMPLLGGSRLYMCKTLPPLFPPQRDRTCLYLWQTLAFRTALEFRETAFRMSPKFQSMLQSL
jgi:hypothetical protein